MTLFRMYGCWLMLMFGLPLMAQTSIKDLRDGFFRMNEIRCGQRAFFEQIQPERHSSPLHQAYAGAAEAAIAECVPWPHQKLAYFNRGKDALEKAVTRDPQNPEIRFLRFATQAHIPSFLNYNNLREDVSLILEKLPLLMNQSEDRPFWIRALRFMSESGKLTAQEKSIVDQWLKPQSATP